MPLTYKCQLLQTSNRKCVVVCKVTYPVCKIHVLRYKGTYRYGIRIHSNMRCRGDTLSTGMVDYIMGSGTGRVGWVRYEYKKGA